MTKEPAPPGRTAPAAIAARTVAGPVEGPGEASRPLLMVDVDGVISLFAGAAGPRDRSPEEGRWHSVDGMVHFLSVTAAAHLLALADDFELVWATGWEERADEHLPHLLGLPAGLPFLRFERVVGRANAHWKLDAIDTYAEGRPLAWIDDALGPACEAWAAARSAPTLLVKTDPELGLTAEHADLLTRWARSLAR
jgi:hypothetical protein